MLKILFWRKEIVLASYAIFDELGSEWTSNVHITNTRIIGGSPDNSKKEVVSKSVMGISNPRSWVLLFLMELVPQC